MAFLPQGAMASARFSPDGKQAVTGSWDKTARIWDIETGLVKLRLVGHANYVNDAVFSPDGKLVATAGRDNQAILWDAVTGAVVYRFAGDEGHHGPVTSVAFDKEGRRLVTASQDKTAKIWDVPDASTLGHAGSRAAGRARRRTRHRRSFGGPALRRILSRRRSRVDGRRG